MNEIKVRKCKVERAPWLVVVPADVSESGKRERKVFAQKVDAERLVAELRSRRQGLALDLTPEQMADARVALSFLRDCGGELARMSLTACVRELRRVLSEQEKKKVAVRSAQTVGAMCAAVLTATREAGRSAKYLKEMTRVLDALADGFRSVAVTEVTVAQLDKWVSSFSKGATARRQARTIAGIAFEWCVRKGWRVDNPMRRTDRVTVVRGETRVFTPGEVRALLDGCGDDVELRSWLALLLYAGIRPDGEASRLRWGQVGVGVTPENPNGFVEVAARQAKTAARRLVRIEPVLARALVRPALASVSALVKPVNARKRLARALAASGVRWSQDVCRHTFASYNLAHFGDLERLRREMGHTGTQIIFRHYQALVTADAAREFWEANQNQNQGE